MGTKATGKAQAKTQKKTTTRKAGALIDKRLGSIKLPKNMTYSQAENFIVRTLAMI